MLERSPESTDWTRPKKLWLRSLEWRSYLYLPIKNFNLISDERLDVLRDEIPTGIRADDKSADQ